MSARQPEISCTNPQNLPLHTHAQVEVILWDGFCHAEFLLAPCLHRSLARAIHKQERGLGLAASP